MLSKKKLQAKKLAFESVQNPPPIEHLVSVKWNLYDRDLFGWDKFI